MTVVRVTAYSADARVHMFGLSTDTKPTAGVNIGERFWETDTEDIFSWSGTAWLLEVGLRAEDFALDVSRGRVPGMSTVVLRGHNPSQTAASGFVQVSEFGNLTYLTSAETMNIVSDDANDTLLGTGARTGTIFGVDGDGIAVQENFNMNGTTNVLTTQAFLRVNLIVILTDGGVLYPNVGIITATASSAATIQQKVGAKDGLSKSSHYTVPSGKTGHVFRLEFNCSKNAGGTAPVVEFHAYARPGGSSRSFLQFFDKKLDADVDISLDVDLPFPTSDTQLIAKSDFFIESDTDQNDTEVSTRMYLFLIDD